MAAKARTSKKATNRKKSPVKKNENKTMATRASVTGFLRAVEGPTRRRDAKTLARIFRKISGKVPKMWGPSVVGYGSYHYKYESGREGDHLRIGFSPRRANLVVYIMPGFSGAAPLLKRLGKHKIGKSCLYLNKLDDIDLAVLEELARESWNVMRERYPE